MIIKVDFESEIPIYIQLKTQIIEAIALGRLEAGTPLPSVRQMASDIGINLHTVNKTYNYLKQDGFITIHRQKGVVVNAIDEPRITDEYISLLKEALRSLTSEAYCRGLKEADFLKMCSDMFNDYNNKR